MTEKTAYISDCGLYRYNLWRVWNATQGHVLFIGLNPSTADDVDDDPTLRRCINYAKDWGFGSICMANLFAFRATDPTDMKKASNPIGPENNGQLNQLAKNASLIVAAWGNHGTFLNRANTVRKMIPNIHHLKLNKSGEPAHPLYLEKSLKPQKWQFSEHK